MRFALVFVLSLGLVQLAGCRSEDDPKTPGSDGDVVKKDGGGGTGDLPGMTGKETTIEKIKTKAEAAGERVTVKGVVVTAVDTGGKFTGDVFVQDPSGSANSGLHIFGRPVLAGGGQSSDLRPGDTVDVTGDVTHFDGGEDPKKKFRDGRLIIQLKNALITKTGIGTPPAPKELAAADLADNAKAGSWDSMLVTVKGAQSLESELDEHGQYRMKGGLEAGTDLFEHTPTAGKCIDITGIVLFFYDHRIHPRDASDIAESTSCVPPKDVSVKTLQDVSDSNRPASDTAVKVTGVISALDGKPTSAGIFKGFWIQDSATAAPWEGIYVYHQWKETDAIKPPALGNKVVVTGSYTEFHDMSQIEEVVSIEDQGADAAPTPVDVTAADIATGAASYEQYEGVLVRIQNVKVGKSVDNGKTGDDLYQYGFTLAGADLDVKNDLHDFGGKTPVAKDTEYSAIVGVLSWSFDRVVLMPRFAADLQAK